MRLFQNGPLANCAAPTSRRRSNQLHSSLGRSLGLPCPWLITLVFLGTLETLEPFPAARNSSHPSCGCSRAPGFSPSRTPKARHWPCHRVTLSQKQHFVCALSTPSIHLFITRFFVSEPWSIPREPFSSNPNTHTHTQNHGCLLGWMQLPPAHTVVYPISHFLQPAAALIPAAGPIPGNLDISGEPCLFKLLTPASGRIVVTSARPHELRPVPPGTRMSITDRRGSRS
ncbi:uncharacterized protein CLUP02_07640 [Colletotrichum lupini]|uniref:Uncharacterized protein n=1 Tax=Colletotrichum lupini TaxID=145971 RepID=A0A9Q8SRC9_9PEZI|nr:uncharacterized protein CLUP02_07640 [Colletotrichum lupini]UQC82154.1 hypothetical protein CLUP02_07640 [Colletotrichum lupini]